MTLWATRRHRRRLFDHIVGGRKEGRGYFEAQGFRGLRIDNQFVLAGRLYRQLTRLCASQDAVDVIGGFQIHVGIIRPIGEQTTFLDNEASEINGRQFVAGRQRDDWLAVDRC